jgi:hypothetical protein
MLDLRRMALERAMEIGFKLRCWRDLVPHGKWAKWCEANIPEIRERTIQHYIQLWDNNELIWSHFKSETVSDLDQVVGVREALEFLQGRRAAEAKPNSAKRLPSGGKSVQKPITIKAEMLDKICSACRALIENASASSSCRIIVNTTCHN